MISIDLADPKDVFSLSELHLAYLPSKLVKCRHSLRLLFIFYSSLIAIQDNICLIARLHGQIIGYICLIKNFNKIYKNLIKNYHMELIFNLIMVTTKQPDFLYTILPKRIMEFGSVFFLKNNRSKKMNSLLNERRGLMYELKAIVVIKNYQGQNIAMKLLDHSEDILRAKGEKKYFLGVLQDNLRAINFYKKAGFLVMGSERNNALIMEKILT